MMGGTGYAPVEIYQDVYDAVVYATAKDINVIEPAANGNGWQGYNLDSALFNGGRVTGLVKFDAEETLRLIEKNRVQWVNFVPTMMHRIWALPDDVRTKYDCSSVRVSSTEVPRAVSTGA